MFTTKKLKSLPFKNIRFQHKYRMMHDFIWKGRGFVIAMSNQNKGGMHFLPTDELPTLYWIDTSGNDASSTTPAHS